MIERTLFREEHHIWRETVRRFMETEVVPHHAKWEEDGIVPRELWLKAGEAGLLCCTVPEEYGGLGLDYLFDVVVFEELWRVGASAPGFLIHTDLVATYILGFGTPEQKAKWLPRMVRGEAIGSLGMTEPHAGSDLKAIRTRAVRDGDDFVLNGQKIWTSGAHTADAIFALVRTDPQAPKHRGISFLLIDDIKTPGITIRPLTDMGGRHYFNEVFFQDVRVPARNLVGEENRGWYVGMTLLDFERSNIGGAVGARRKLHELIDVVRANPVLRERVNNSSVRQEIAQRFIETEVMYQFSLRVISMQNRGQVPNDEASTSKLYNSELSQRLAQTAMQAVGMLGNLIEGSDESFGRSYIGVVPATIRGGTSEVQRNVIATRGLGLPRG